MKCITCRGELENSKYSEYKDFGTCIIFVRDIPCRKCTTCGELVYSLKTGVRVDEIINTLKEIMSKDVAVVQYSEDEINAVQYTEAITIAA